MEKERVRLDYLDIAKFITIFLVIFGHCYDSLDQLPYYSKIIYTFHMPLFFLVAGVTTRRHRHEYNGKHWLNFLIKNILTIFIPYFVFALIFGDYSFPNILKILYASREKLFEVNTVTALWFLPCLFVSRFMVEGLLALSTRFEKVDRHLIGFLFAIPMFAIGLLLPAMEGGWPWSIKSAFVASGFMLLGYASKDWLTKSVEKPYWYHIICSCLCLGIFLAFVLPRGNDIPFLGMYIASYPDPLFMFESALPGIGFILSISIIISKLISGHKIAKPILWVGRSTLGIYIIHFTFLNQIAKPLIKQTGLSAMNPLYALLCSLLTFAFCIVVTILIDIFIPSLLGKPKSSITLELTSDDTK